MGAISFPPIDIDIEVSPAVRVDLIDIIELSPRKLLPPPPPRKLRSSLRSSARNLASFNSFNRNNLEVVNGGGTLRAAARSRASEIESSLDDVLRENLRFNCLSLSGDDFLFRDRLVVVLLILLCVEDNMLLLFWWLYLLLLFIGEEEEHNSEEESGAAIANRLSFSPKDRSASSVVAVALLCDFI